MCRCAECDDTVPCDYCGEPLHPDGSDSLPDAYLHVDCAAELAAGHGSLTVGERNPSLADRRW